MFSFFHFFIFFFTGPIVSHKFSKLAIKERLFFLSSSTSNKPYRNISRLVKSMRTEARASGPKALLDSLCLHCHRLHLANAKSARLSKADLIISTAANRFRVCAHNRDIQRINFLASPKKPSERLARYLAL
jgi:hypothetical protein